MESVAEKALTKKEIQEELDLRGISYKAAQPKEELLALLEYDKHETNDVVEPVAQNNTEPIVIANNPGRTLKFNIRHDGVDYPAGVVIFPSDVVYSIFEKKGFLE